MSHELETSPDPPPVQVGKAYMMEPLFNAEGVLRAVAVVDAESGAITMVVPPENVTFAEAD